MNKEEFIGLKSAKDLFGFIEKMYENYYSDPSEQQIVALIFLLNHLRDWIAEGMGWDEIRKIPMNKRTRGQVFYGDIHNIPEYRYILNPLCNGIKHFKIEIVTEPISGFVSGTGRSGDSLSQKYFLIDGKDSRNIFEKILEKYRSYFH